MRRHSNDPVGEDGGPESGTRLVRWAKSYTGDFRFMLDMVLPEASWENGETSPFADSRVARHNCIEIGNEPMH